MTMGECRGARVRATSCNVFREMLHGATAEWAGRAPPSGVVADLDAIALQQLDQFAALVHLADDVAAADALALQHKMPYCRTGAEFLDSLTQPLILKAIHAI